LGGFANSRLGEAILPEQDGASLKTQFSAERVLDQKPLGELLLLSLGRDELAWTKITVLSHCSTPAKPEIHRKHQAMHIHSIMNTTQSPEMQNKIKNRQNKFKTRNPSFPYLEILAKDSDTQIVEHSSFRSRFESWKTTEQI